MAMELKDGSRVAVIGGGPAGTFTAYFLLDMADRIDMDLEVDLFETKDFNRLGPVGCNHCGGIISELLIQLLASEGIILPSTVAQRGIEAYMVHSDGLSARIETPLHEKRIASVFRGGGPNRAQHVTWRSFDGYLLELALGKGANLIRTKVKEFGRFYDRITVSDGNLSYGPYDLLVGAVGVNSKSLGLFTDLGLKGDGPRTTRAYIGELNLGRDLVNGFLGDCMHVFLQDIPGLEFAAIIPKGDYATLCLVGENIDRELLDGFLDSKEVRRLFPPDIGLPDRLCQCKPLMNIAGPRQLYADRVVLVGDCGVTRLYKDGIGAAYRTAKTLAATAIFQGVSKDDFREFYEPMCRRLIRDNKLGRMVFLFVSLIRKWAPLRRAVVTMVMQEQRRPDRKRSMSTVMWDTFTGSAPYSEILLRTLAPGFIARLGKEVVGGVINVQGGNGNDKTG